MKGADVVTHDYLIKMENRWEERFYLFEKKMYKINQTFKLSKLILCVLSFFLRKTYIARCDFVYLSYGVLASSAYWESLPLYGPEWE